MLLNISTRRNVAIDLVARGLVTQAEASKLIGEGRQAFAYMARNVDAIAARAQYVDELWREEIAKLKKKAQEENKAMRRRGNSMAGLSQNARAWLRGDKSCCVFFRGKPADELESYGNKPMVTLIRCVGSAACDSQSVTKRWKNMRTTRSKVASTPDCILRFVDK
jgi:hypothetical protein